MQAEGLAMGSPLCPVVIADFYMEAFVASANKQHLWHHHSIGDLLMIPSSYGHMGTHVW